VSALQSEFDGVFGAMQATVDGENISFGQATARLREPDRSVREAAWRGIDDRWQEDHRRIGELVLTLLPLWREIANHAGLPDFRAYSWRELNRLDYTPEDCFAFHDAVQAEIVPLARALGTARRHRLGSLLRPGIWWSIPSPDPRYALCRRQRARRRSNSHPDADRSRVWEPLCAHARRLVGPRSRVRETAGR
jgi:oligoendopeptidase F